MADKRLAIILIRLKNMRAYWLDFLIGIANYPFMIVIAYFLWKVILSNTQIGDATLDSMTSYYIITYAVSWIANQQGVVNTISRDIKEGNISTRIIRPMSYISYHFWGSFAHFLFNLVLFSAILGITWMIYPQLQMTSDPLMLIMFLASLVMAFAMNFSMYFCMGLLALWMQDTWGLVRIFNRFKGLLSGSWIPLSLLPSYVSSIAFLLPFQYALYFPAQIAMEKISLQQSLEGLVVMFAWTVFMLLLAKLIWKIGERKIIGFGV